ncbi:AlpA family transcriptional regulator [Sphingomonas sp. H39-1-10]|uniref:helix-turn-helix transcriptional regulator n=1 Tax=Sphingomonas pollutisoli TaxID=3030829 RepID=UPI0023B8A0B1|nr:AlpA family transcriptional regulator [Sphingomonas pollutisoli]MDF0489173.1 AlpA family transcriptional regulator [Sphingomonas pollutisoli]
MDYTQKHDGAGGEDERGEAKPVNALHSLTTAQRKSRGSVLERGRFLRINDVVAITGLSRATIYRLIDRADFPRQFQLTKRAIGWWQADVEAWVESRLGNAA